VEGKNLETLDTARVARYLTWLIPCGGIIIIIAQLFQRREYQI